MKILFCGDVVGRAGRDAVRKHVPCLRRELDIDLVVVNAENAAGGFGLTERLCGEFYDCGVDVLTTGNHVWDQREIIPYIGRDPCLLRPANFPKDTPGAGWRVHPVGERRVLVINLMGRLFMDALDDPFARLDDILAGYRLGEDVAAILVDFHAEASSEKMALGHFADGRVSAVFGTHSHVPTADAQVLPGGRHTRPMPGCAATWPDSSGCRRHRRCPFRPQDARRTPPGSRRRGYLVRHFSRNGRSQRPRPSGRTRPNRRSPHASPATALRFEQLLFSATAAVLKDLKYPPAVS